MAPAEPNPASEPIPAEPSSPDQLTPSVEARIDEWRGCLERRSAIGIDSTELEGHLRDQIDDLTKTGLTEDEAFLVAVSRIGRIDELSREFAREHTDRLWRQLVIGEPDPADNTHRRNFRLAIGFAVLGALLIKLPRLFGVTTSDDRFLLNGAVLVLTALAGYLLCTRLAPKVVVAAVTGPFLAVALALNLYPFATTEELTSDTAGLAAAAAFVLLWLICGIAYANGFHRSRRIDFIRFTGEWVIYYTLLALGGGVLLALTGGVFEAAGFDISDFLAEWLLPCGAAGAVVITAWLVEAKQSVVENIAPVLTKVFTPLFTILLLALIVAIGIQVVAGGGLIDAEREFLIIFDLVLVVVVGLVLYTLSARPQAARPDWFDTMQLVLVAAAIVIDLTVLVAMVSRIGAFGVSPNKVASLGVNLILLINLCGSAWLQFRFIRGRDRIDRLLRWQTAFLPGYLAWSAIIVFVFPLIFGFA